MTIDSEDKKRKVFIIEFTTKNIFQIPLLVEKIRLPFTYRKSDIQGVNIIRKH